MTPHGILEWLGRARMAVRGGDSSGNLQVLLRRDGAEAVAFLVTLEREQGDLVVPLRVGRNFVGRGVGSKPFGVWPNPPAVEQAQWFIECQAGTARVWDASSTNLSVLIPNALSELAFGASAPAFAELFDAPGAIPIAHPNSPSAEHKREIHEGDALRGVYASFVFGWL